MLSWRNKLILPLFGVVAFGVVGCGGKAIGQERNLNGGGAGGASSSSGGAAGADTKQQEPNTVHLTGDEDEIDSQAAAKCLQGFQGFTAHVGGMNVDFIAFVFEPGDYQGDPLQILWLEARGANGEHYVATAGPVEYSGSISLHVEQVEPRFIGSIKASIPAVDDPIRPALMLSLSFDVAVQAGCR